MEEKSRARLVLLQEADLSFEVVILIIGGMTMVIVGFLLFPVHKGILPYYENGLYGLLLIMFALQMIVLGKTPFGSLPRSRPLFALGMIIAMLGMVTCFIPLSAYIPRLLLFFCLVPGGLALLLQMFLARDKFRKWVSYGGIFLHLIVACILVYIFSILVGLFIGKQDLISTPVREMMVIAYGGVILYLAEILRKIYRKYPEAEKHPPGEIGLAADRAVLILMGVFMFILGALLIPVNMGLIPFSASAQLGLLMVIFAIQMLAFGSTPIGPFTRSWIVVLFGLLFAVAGVVSCVIPGILVNTLTIVVGLLNILGGIISLIKMFAQIVKLRNSPWHSIPLVYRKLFITQLTLNLLAIMFGTSMLIPELVKGMTIGVILAANGGVLLYLLRIMALMDKMQVNANVTD